MKRKLKMGMVGGDAARLSERFIEWPPTLTGKSNSLLAPSHQIQKSRDFRAGTFYLDPSRVYGSYEEMAKKEAELPIGERIDFVSIVVQNHLHFAAIKCFLQAGFNVICDKPLAFDMSEARSFDVL